VVVSKATARYRHPDGMRSVANVTIPGFHPFKAWKLARQACRMTPQQTRELAQALSARGAKVKFTETGDQQ